MSGGNDSFRKTLETKEERPMQSSHIKKMVQRTAPSLALLAAFVAQAQSQSPERITPPGVNSYAFDVNDSGMAVGFLADANYAQSAAAWDPQNNPILLETVGIESNAVAVNNSGVVAGWARSLTTSFLPYKWVNGQAILLESFGLGGRAYDINEAGEISGYVIAPTGDTYWACKWSPTGDLEILEINGEPRPFSTGLSINDLGHVAGPTTLPHTSAALGIWGDQGFTELGTNLVFWSSPYAILNNGEVFGFGVNSVGEGTGVVRWSPTGASVLLPPANASYTAQVFNANEMGVAVGWTGFIVGPFELQTRATVWENNVPRLLQQPEGSSVTLYGVNEANTAVGVVKVGLGAEFYAARWNLGSNPAPAPIVIAPPDPAEPGETITLRATVNEAPIINRPVTFRFGSTNIGVRNTNAQGEATVSYTVPINTAAGPVEVMASLGGSRYQVATLQVNKAATRLTASRGSTNSKTSMVFQATLLNNRRNSPLGSQLVRFRFGSRSYTIVTNSRGQARVSVPMSVIQNVRGGQYTVTYSGNAGHEPSTASSPL